jgi:hypothetical protein
MRSVEKSFSKLLVPIALVRILGGMPIITKAMLPLVLMSDVRKSSSKSPVPIVLARILGRMLIILKGK